MKEIHHSIDIETLALRSDAFIASIGIVKFDPYRGAVQPYEELRNQSMFVRVRADTENGYIDPLTVHWWLAQSQQAIADTFEGPSHSAKDVCDMIYSFVNGKPPSVISPIGAYAWANPNVFDLAALRSFFLRHDTPYPFHYTKDLDGATMQFLTGVDDPPIEFVGTKHHALDDAIHQAREIQWHMANL